MPLIVSEAGTGAEARKLLEDGAPSILVTDLDLPDGDGMDLVRLIRERNWPTSAIVITGVGGVREAVEALHLGAIDFLPKPVDIDHLQIAVNRILREKALEDEVSQLREKLMGHSSYHGLISKSPRMLAVFELIENLAGTTTTVLVNGETGTGKERIARALHEASVAYRKGPMVAVNCAALPENLLESELFGHEKGAFTGAIGMRRGRFELANLGTLFLDEVGEIPMAMQAKLLRALQERRFERVGGTDTVDVDVRIVAATNRPLERMVQKNRFREDLFYRLNVVRIDLPPLRERTEDIPLLVSNLSKRFVRPNQQPKEFLPDALETLMSYNWPGNIRELENVIERVAVTTAADRIGREQLPPDLFAPRPAKSRLPVDLSLTLPELLTRVTNDIERRYLEKALQKCRGNVGAVAKVSGLSRRSISTKLAEYQLDKARFKEGMIVD